MLTVFRGVCVNSLLMRVVFRGVCVNGVQSCVCVNGVQRCVRYRCAEVCAWPVFDEPVCHGLALPGVTLISRAIEPGRTVLGLIPHVHSLPVSVEVP